MNPQVESVRSEAPPVEYHPVPRVEGPSTWPTGFGVFSIVYGVVGMLTTIFGLLMTLFSEAYWNALMGVDVAVPSLLRVTTVILSVPLLALGVLLLAGAIGLVRRRRRSVTLIKSWVAARIVFAFLTLLSTPIVAQAQLDYQEAIYEALDERAAQRGEAPPPRWGAGSTTSAYVWAGIGALVVCVYPFVLGFWLSRPRIRDEVAAWR